MVSRSNPTIPATDRTRALNVLLRKAARDRLVAPPGQPFAFKTHRGKVRKDNQDTALVLTGRRTASSQPFLAAILCDGMGGLAAGDEAADRAAASLGAMLARAEHAAPLDRMAQAIQAANTAVFECFRGRAGTVLVAALVEGQQVVIGWVGDARVYGLAPGKNPEPLTHDDTVAAEIERLEGPAPDAMDTLLRAVGTKPELEPHVLRLKPGFPMLLLVSDGVHRIDPAALAWIHRHARSPTEVVERLVAAACWEGGQDNATALVVDLGKPLALEEDGQVLSAWVEAQPRTWQVQVLPAEQGAKSRSKSQARSEPARTTREERPSTSLAAASTAPEPRLRPEQPPLGIELGSPSRDKP